MRNKANLRPEFQVEKYNQFADAVWLRFKTKQAAQEFLVRFGQNFTSHHLKGAVLNISFEDRYSTKRFMHTLYEKRTKWAEHHEKYGKIRRDENGNKIHNSTLAHGNGPSARANSDTEP